MKQGRNRTCKPGSVENSDLSWLYVAIQLAPPFGTRRAAALFLLVLLRIGFTWQYSRLYSGELLPRLSILAKKIFGGFFLLHFPSSRLGLPLAGIPPCGARTFLTMPFPASRRCPIRFHTNFIVSENGPSVKWPCVISDLWNICCPTVFYDNCFRLRFFRWYLPRTCTKRAFLCIYDSTAHI